MAKQNQKNRSETGGFLHSSHYIQTLGLNVPLNSDEKPHSSTSQHDLQFTDFCLNTHSLKSKHGFTTLVVFLHNIEKRTQDSQLERAGFSYSFQTVPVNRDLKSFKRKEFMNTICVEVARQPRTSVLKRSDKLFFVRRLQFIFQWQINIYRAG